MKKMKVGHVKVSLDDFFYKKLHRMDWKVRTINRQFDVYINKTTLGGAKYKLSIQEIITGIVGTKFKDGNSLNCQLDNLT
jgi:hypothetical protein